MLTVAVVAGALLLVGLAMLVYCTEEREYAPRASDELNKKNSNSNRKN